MSMTVQQAANKLMAVALSSSLSSDDEYIQAVKTLADAGKDSLSLLSHLRAMVNAQDHQVVITKQMNLAHRNAKRYLLDRHDLNK